MAFKPMLSLKIIRTIFNISGQGKETFLLINLSKSKLPKRNIAMTICGWQNRQQLRLKKVLIVTISNCKNNKVKIVKVNMKKQLYFFLLEFSIESY
jgi:hypothetical protein